MLSTKNTSLAVKGALANHLERRTACKIQNGRQGAPKWPMETGKKLGGKKEKEQKKYNKYQPSGEGGTRSPPATPHRLQRHPTCNTTPPAKSKMAARGPQNGRRGLGVCPLVLGAPIDFR